MTPRTRLPLLLAPLLALLAAVNPAGADLLLQTAPADLKPQPQHILFVPMLQQDPLLDGKLDEPQWQQAAAIGDWIDRTSGAKADSGASVLIFATPSHLHIGYRQRNVAGANLKQPTGGDEYGGSVLEMFFDPFGGKHRTKVQIVTNALGLRYDAFDGDTKWTGQWRSAGHVDEQGWSIEAAIPFDDMRQQHPRVRPFWKANFGVVLQRDAERSWSWTGGWGDPGGDYGILYFGTPQQYRQSLRPQLSLALDRLTYDVRDRAGAGLIRLQSPTDMLADLALNIRVNQGDRLIAQQAIASLAAADLHFLFDVQALPIGEYELTAELRRGQELLSRGSRKFSKKDRQVLPAASPRGAVPVIVAPQPQLAGTPWPITTAVPFSPGSLHAPQHVRLLDPQGQPVPLQTVVRSTWSPRGSIQWLGLDFIPTLSHSAQTYTLEYGEHLRNDQDSPLKVQQSDEQIDVDTGPLQFRVNRRQFALISQAAVHGQTVIEPRDGAGLLLVDHEGNRYRSALDQGAQVVIEEQGPTRLTIRATGWYVREGSSGQHTSVELPTDRLCLFTVRLSAFAGSTLIKCSVSTTLTFDSDQVRLRELTISLPTGARQIDVGTQQGAVPIQDGGYLLQHRHDASVDQDNAAHARGEGWCQWQSAGQPMALAVRRFWQLFPKEISLRDGLLNIHPWPAHGRDDTYDPQQQLDLAHIYKLRYAHQGRELNFQFPAAYVQRLDEAYAANPGLGSPYYKEMSYANAQGMNIHTDLLLDLGGGLGGPALQRLVNDHPHAMAEPSHTCGSGVFGPLLHAAEPFAALEQANLRGWLHLAGRADAAGDYGMFIYGNWNNSFNYSAQPMAANLHRVWCNGHYAVARAPYVQYARSGDARWMDWGRDLSNTLRDVAMVHYVSTQRSFPYHQLGAVYHCKGFAPWAGDAHVAAHPICIDHLIYDYLLFGNMHSRDALQHWIAGIKAASPSGFSTREGMTTMAELIEAYRLTWDGGLIELLDRFRAPIVKQFDDQTSWDYHPLLVMRDWSFSGDEALLQAARQAVAHNPRGNSPGGTQHLDAFFAMLDRDPMRLQRWSGELYRSAQAVLDRPGQFGDGMTEVMWYSYIYALHKQPYTLKAMSQFGLTLQRPLHTAPAPVLQAGGGTRIALQEASDEAFTVTLRTQQPHAAAISARVLREDGQLVASGTLAAAAQEPAVIAIPADGVAAQYLVIIEGHSLHDALLWPMSSLRQEVALAPAGQALEFTAADEGLRLYMPTPPRDARYTITSTEKAASAIEVVDGAQQVIARGSSSRYLGGAQELTIPAQAQPPLSLYLTGLMTLRGQDASTPLVLALDAQALFEVKPALLKP